MLAVLVLVGAGLALVAPAGAQEPGTGQVVVVHGLRGLVADVYVNGKVVLEAFKPERVTDPLTLPAGSYKVEIREAGDPVSAKPLLTATIKLVAGDRLSAVAHLGDDKKPTVSLFRDNVRPVTAGRSRLVLRDTAAAPDFDVLLDGRELARKVSDQGQSESEISAKPYKISLLAKGKALAPPQDLPLGEGTVNFLYLIGSASDDSLSWISSMVANVSLPPAAVQTGNSGLAEDSRDDSFPVLPVALFVSLALGAGWVLRRPLLAAATTARTS
ncbi:MAG: DUF4397 domain-containing protein [Acidimicrobiales bacterium]